MDLQGGPQAARAVSRQDIPALTAIRGLAAWWVVLYHFDEYFPSYLAFLRPFTRPGFLAVDLFFVLSGFIIAYNYLSIFQRVTVSGVLHFLGIRLARVYPLHFFMLMIYLINPLAIALAASAPIDPVRYGPAYFIMSIFLVQNWGFTSDLAWNVPAWSISTEWLAYLLFPWAALLVNRFVVRGWHSLGVIIVALGLLAYWLAKHHLDLGADIPVTGPVRCVLEFLAGMCVYKAWVAWQHYPATFHVSTVGAVIGLASFAAFDLPDYTIIPATWVLLVYALARSTGPLPWLLSGKILGLIGLYSYSTYMVHYFVRDWVKFLLIRDGTPSIVPLTVFLAATAVASVLLYHWIEVPQRRRLRAVFVRLSPAA